VCSIVEVEKSSFSERGEEAKRIAHQLKKKLESSREDRGEEGKA